MGGPLAVTECTSPTQEALRCQKGPWLTRRKVFARMLLEKSFVFRPSRVRIADNVKSDLAILNLGTFVRRVVQLSISFFQDQYRSLMC